MEEFQKLFVENEVLKDSVTGLQQQYRSTAESNEVSRIFGYLVVEHKSIDLNQLDPFSNWVCYF